MSSFQAKIITDLPVIKLKNTWSKLSSGKRYLQSIIHMLIYMHMCGPNVIFFFTKYYKEFSMFLVGKSLFM